MIYIYDEDDYKGDFGSNEMWNFVYTVAQNNKLIYLQTLLDNGFTIDVRDVIADIEKVEWPSVDGMAEGAAEIIGGLMKCKSIAFLE